MPDLSGLVIIWIVIDPTGSRRFLCVEIKGGRSTAAILVDHDQLYAQAIYLLRAGERYWFTHEEELAVTRQNEGIRAGAGGRAVVVAFSCRSSWEDGGDWLSVAEIMQHIRKRSRLSFSNTTINGFGRFTAPKITILLPRFA